MKRARWLASAAVILLVIYAGSKVNWRSAGGTIVRSAPAPLIAAILINVTSVALRGVRWWIFLRRAGPVPLGVAVRGAIVGSGFNNLLVANGGDATRALLVSRSTGVAGSSVLATLALDRIFDPICFVVLLFAATFTTTLPAQLAGTRSIATAALVVALLVLTMLVKSSGTADADPMPTDGWRARIRAFRDQVAFLSTSRRFAMAMLVSIGVWTLQITVFALIAHSVGIALPLAGSIAAMLLTNTGLLLRATPGNVGYFQFAYAVAAAHFGVKTDAAVAAALLLQVVQIVPVTILAVTLAPRLARSAQPRAD